MGVLVTFLVNYKGCSETAVNQWHARESLLSAMRMTVLEKIYPNNSHICHLYNYLMRS
jgi:hypothetical protein